MSYRELPVTFECDGHQLIGVVAIPDGYRASHGVLVVVGGPQYRVGSHRQFVLLSRTLAERGVPCMRFDYRGMGDSRGEQRDFEEVDDDIGTAIDAFLAAAPWIDRVVLWGLCDGASAACFYAPTDSRIAGLVLLNPWVRTEAGAAKTYLKHYYLRRVIDLGFWRKLFSGGVALREAMSSFLRAARVARPATAGSSRQLPARMASCLRDAAVPFLIILSGRDYVAREFEDVAREEEWGRTLRAGTVRRLDAADHTFSTAQWRRAVEDLTAEWILALEDDGKSGRLETRAIASARNDH